ncbi:CHASE2 domain-containing protein [Gluconacetobacter sp. Hr-1-5]|uniref:CHASE2 domain-containing protein n=1 Tax=Gluconacetobacter sp. Hr-1-5 TaxID=3395370 RepID=UPI003B51E28D
MSENKKTRPSAAVNASKPHSARPSFRCPICYFILMILFWVLFKLLDPLAMESATKASSARFLAGISDAFYGMQADPARNRIAVVEVTDTDLSSKYFDATWPLTYARHAELIDRMLDAKPAAIMVDIRFNVERAGESLHDAFDPVIARAKQMGVPLFFARGKLGEGYDDLPAPLTDLQVVNGWDMRTGFYPLLLAPPAPEAPEAAGTEGRPGKEEEEETPKTVPVAAFALYRALCASGWQKSCPADLSERTFGQPLVERWGLRASQHQELYAKTEGCTFDARDRPASRVGDAVSIALRALFGYFSENIRQNCQYHLTVPARYLDRNLEPDITALEPALKNRVVFYGTQINGDHDVVDVPMIGAVPGVQEHAMVLDNLLTYNAHYFREPGEWIDREWLTIDSAECLEFFVWMLFATYGYSTLRQKPVMRASGWKIALGVAVVMMLAVGSLYVTGRASEHEMLFAAGISCVILSAYAWAQDASRKIADSIPSHNGRIGAGVSLLCVCLLGMDVRFMRHSMYGIWALFIAYTILGLLLYFSILIFRKKPQERRYFGKLWLSVTIVAVMFVLNEDFLLWPMEDWIGFVLLWLALGETEEDRSFVRTLLERWPGKCVSVKNNNTLE